MLKVPFTRVLLAPSAVQKSLTTERAVTGKRKEKVQYLCFWLGFPLVPGNLTLRSTPGQRRGALCKQQPPRLTEGNEIVCPCIPVDVGNLPRYCGFRVKSCLAQALNEAIFTPLALQMWEQRRSSLLQWKNNSSLFCFVVVAC